MMAGPDPDDWFADPAPRRRPEPVEVERDRDRGRGDDWLASDRPRSRPRSTRRLGWRHAVAVVLLVLVVLGLLALSGVFSNNQPHTARPPIETPPAASTATTTTTPATTSSAKPVLAPKTPLKPGDTGSQVKLLQRALASLGFSSGTIDGRYGPATTNAVARFQQSVKITADGVAGPATLAALTVALRGP